jgi:catechol 2,3-dioxygenase-like lactoylglutathione lyase family enzyme
VRAWSARCCRAGPPLRACSCCTASPLPTAARAGLPVQVHVSDADEFAPPAEVAAWLEAAIRTGADAQVFTYQHAGHFFTDPSLPDHHALATTVAWQRVLEFLRTVSGRRSPAGLRVEGGYHAKMLNNARIEARIPTRDLVRARRWYAEKLGLEPVEERDGGLRYEGATGVFCLYASAGRSDGSFTQMGFYVDDIEAAVADLRARGVVFEQYDGATNGIMDIEGNYPSKGRGERAAWFRDSEGNLLGIAEVVR